MFLEMPLDEAAMNVGISVYFPKPGGPAPDCSAGAGQGKIE
jgi:hypothetical protein